MEKSLKSMHSYDIPTISSPTFDFAPALTRSITTKRRFGSKHSKNNPSSVQILAAAYLKQAKVIMNEETQKTLALVENLDHQLDSVKLPLVKSPDTVQSLVNVGGVLKKEWPFFSTEGTPLAVDKYKAKDFHLPELRSSKSTSKLAPASTHTRRTSVISWLANYAMSTTGRTTLETVDADDVAEKETGRDIERKVGRSERAEKYSSLEGKDESTLRSEYVGAFDSTLYTDREARELSGMETQRPSGKKATMKLVRHGAYKVPEGLYETILRRKKILNEVKNGAKNIDKLLKEEQEPPKRKGGRSVSTLQRYVKPKN